MGRQTTYEVGKSAFNYYLSDRESDIGQTFLAEIDSGLQEYILPGSFGDAFDPEEVDLYVETRKWVAGAAKPGSEFTYEEFLHQHYWPSLASDCPLLVMSGSEGIGKSTLVRYYFDCYLPNIDRFPYVGPKDQDPEDWKRKLQKHVCLYFDLRRGTTTDQVTKQIFRSFRWQLTRIEEFKNISIQNDYAMWARAANWDDPLHEDAERVFQSRQAYRGDYVKALFHDDELFVREALWYITGQEDAKGNRKYYITRILDNVDQQDWDMKKYVLKTVLGWIKSEQHAWKVIVPLRPETLRELSGVLQPFGPIEIVEVGEVDQQMLIEKRGSRIEREIEASRKQVEGEEFIDELGNTAYVAMPNFQAAAQMKHMLIFDAVLEAGSWGRSHALRGTTKDLVEKFCNGSVRRFLRLRKRLAMSVPLERAARRRKSHKGEPVPDYIFLSGVLTGGRDHYHRDDPDNDIVNLYDTTDQPPCAYTLLIGVHMLYLIRGCSFTRNELLSRLTRIGYREGEVLDCLDTLYDGCFFKRECIESSGNYRILKENNIVEAYVDMITRPAYTDTMATVTPVEEHLRRRMVHTVPCAPEQFEARAETTRSFLRQIREDENTIKTWRSDSPRHGMNARMFRTDFDDLGLPSVYRKAAVECRNSMEKLRHNPKGLAAAIGSNDWSILLNDDILRVEPNEARMPLKARIV